jgi:putative aldouronate transport system substrate-binding protein
VNETKVWDWFQEKTNIRIKIREIQDADQASVIFASRDFPDFSSGGIPGALLDNAAYDGDVVALDDYLKQYAPTWNALFNNNPLTKSACSLDSKVYYLPAVFFSGFDRGIRDQLIMTTSWLEELGLKVPATTEELKNVLLAFKNNAGKGSIPRNVIPFLYRFEEVANSGYYEIFNMFGLDLSVTNDYLAVNNGRVVYQAVNPDIKEPLKYLQELYRLGLTPPEVFTVDWNTFLSNTSAEPAMVGLYGEYHVLNTKYQEAILPPRSPNGKKPFIRIQALTPNNPRAFAMFANNKDPIATMKFFEFQGMDLEAKLYSNRGLKDVMWEFTPDGKINELIWQNQPDLMVRNKDSIGFNNQLPTLFDSEFYEKYWYDREATVPRTRSYAYQMYTKNGAVQSRDNVYVAATLSKDENEMMGIYATDLDNFRKQTFSRWITTNANIDAEFDAFVAETKKLHFDEWLALKQKAYDRAMGK